MSTEEEAAAADEVCASCGKAGIDDVKLKDCSCNLVKYCSDDCQKNHREQHKKMCRKRLAEIRDDDLFTQPGKSGYGDCPICCLPLSIDVNKSTMMRCCSKLICMGCHYANHKREEEAELEHRCPYCREPQPKSMEDFDKYSKNRLKKNCPVALTEMGKRRRDEGDYESAIEYFTNAAELGDTDAHFELSVIYLGRQGVEKDMKKWLYHSEEAAIGGHPVARHNIGVIEKTNGRFERARKHFIIAANLGFNNSLKLLKKLYAEGHASKEEYADALRAYQAAVDATKSLDREKAEEAINNGGATFFG